MSDTTTTVWTTKPTYGEAVDEANRLNKNPEYRRRGTRFGVLATRAWPHEVRTVDPYLVIKQVRGSSV